MRKRAKSGSCNLKLWKEILLVLRVTGEEKDFGVYLESLERFIL